MEITLVIREQYAAAANAECDEENNGDVFSAKLATAADPSGNVVARWTKFNDEAYRHQPHRTKDPDGRWALLDTLKNWTPISNQLGDGNGATRWGADDRIELYNPFPPSDPVKPSEIALLAYRNKTPAYIQADIAASFGTTLVPWEDPNEEL